MVSRASLAFCKNNRVLSTFVYTTGPLHPELSDTIQHAPSEPLSSTKCRLGSLAWLPELC